MKTILILDNDPVTLHILMGLLKYHSSFFRLLCATSTKKAIELLENEKIHILIAGMHMSEIDAFEILNMLTEEYSGTRIFFIKNNASSMLRTKIRQMSSVLHFDYVQDLGLLIKRIFGELEINYGGQIRGVNLASFLQILELETRSCRLKVATKGKSGTIYFSAGKPIAAKLGGVAGKPAILQILTWQNVLIDIDYTTPMVRSEIDTSLMNLLLESGRILDDKRDQRKDLRKHKRYDCVVGVNYEIDNWTYQCCLRDLSLGGIYLETESPVQVGQRISLLLSSPSLNQSCIISGEVIRRDIGGIGVRFEDLEEQDRQCIQLILENRCIPIS